jgi:predicted acyltransferase
MSSTKTAEKVQRLLALDAFRGFTIAAMILVNFAGNWSNVFSPLKHTEWNGISFTDLIAPFFLFIVGVAIAFACTKRLEAGIPRSGMYSKLILRAVKIFAVGMFLNILGLLPEFNFAELRWTGTLHRIAVSEHPLENAGHYRGIDINWILAGDDTDSDTRI